MYRSAIQATPECEKPDGEPVCQTEMFATPSSAICASTEAAPLDNPPVNVTKDCTCVTRWLRNFRCVSMSRLPGFGWLVVLPFDSSEHR